MPRRSSNSLRVLLVSPSTPRFFEPRMLPMLGILYIASAVRKAGVEPLFWDMNYSTEPPVDEADVLMVTANSATWPIACAAAERISAPVKVVGGPHVTSMGLGGPFNVACMGEGEAVAEHLIRAVSEREPVATVWHESVLSVDDIAWPAYDLWPELAQPSVVAVEGIEPGPGAAIITSRGCPYACYFCDKDMWGRKVRFRAVDDVLAEARYLRDQFGITQLSIKDDMANLNKRRWGALCRGLRDLNMKWRIHTRTDHVSLDEFRMMKECGCVEVGFGVESGSQRMLDLMGKANTVENHERAIRWAEEAGLYSRLYLIVGFPGETWESVGETLWFLRRVPAHRAIVNSFVPYPGCAVWKDPAAFNCTIENHDWGSYWQVGLEDDEGFPCVFPTMSRAELREARSLLQGECSQLFGSNDRREEALCVSP